jgi:hypothetical protein
MRPNDFGPSAPSVSVPERFIRAALKRQNIPFGGRAISRASLQIVLMTRFFCLRVSGAVAPSAPSRIKRIDLSQAIIADGRSHTSYIRAAFKSTAVWVRDV